jgi:hypothetical protein
MSLTSANLVGYLRAEFAKAARLRVTLFFIQLAVAVPPAISVLISDNYKTLLYILSVFGVALLVIWWIVKGLYDTARSAAQAARRGALLLGSLNQPLSAYEVQILRERFTVSADEARKNEKAGYYATTLPPGSGRLAEMLEESALYSEHLQRISSKVMLGILLFFVVLFVVIALATVPFVERDKSLLILRVFLASLVFIMSSDVLGAYLQHRAAAKEIKDVRQRLSTADKVGYPVPDVLLAMMDYCASVESAPESVPFTYECYAKDLDGRWKQYQQDRSAARKERDAT